MDIYKILRLVASQRIPVPLKTLGVWAMHLSGRRLTGVFIDPVLSCNLRCKMCYFSDPSKRAEMHGVMSREQLDAVARALYGRAMKLQIGCGAEPTLCKDLVYMVEQGRAAGIPYISLTTNGQLIASGRVSLDTLVDAGLNELTLSAHGVSREVYEELMPGARYDLFLTLIDNIRSVKKRRPDFKLRINYTVNSLNIHDLRGDAFWRLWEGAMPDVIQLRPVQNMGDTEWNDFDPEPIKENYDDTIGHIISDCAERGITCIAPEKSQIDEVATRQDGVSALIEDLTYCYVSPSICYKSDFDPATDTYTSYHRRRHTARKLFKAVFGVMPRERNTSKKLNYKVK